MASFIDLFSDTVTKPTPAMRRAMAEAEVGNEQEGKQLRLLEGASQPAKLNS